MRHASQLVGLSGSPRFHRVTSCHQAHGGEYSVHGMFTIFGTPVIGSRPTGSALVLSPRNRSCAGFSNAYRLNRVFLLLIPTLSSALRTRRWHTYLYVRHENLAMRAAVLERGECRQKLMHTAQGLRLFSNSSTRALAVVWSNFFLCFFYFPFFLFWPPFDRVKHGTRSKDALYDCPCLLLPLILHFSLCISHLL